MVSVVCGLLSMSPLYLSAQCDVIQYHDAVTSIVDFVEDMYNREYAGLFGKKKLLLLGFPCLSFSMFLKHGNQKCVALFMFAG